MLEVGEKISGTIVPLYVATKNSDSTEGRGKTIDHSYHLTETGAIIACEGIGVSGTSGNVVKRIALKLEDGRYYLFANEGCDIDVVSNEREYDARSILRDRAMKKLTPAEIAALTYPV